VIDDSPAAPSTADQPEVTIEPADNGYVVRHHQRSTKKDEPGRTIRRVASTTDEALSHAKTALSGGSSTKSSKKKSHRGDGAPVLDALSEHALHSSSSASRHRASARRRRPRAGGRR
jgi:hypothetical protein